MITYAGNKAPDWKISGLIPAEMVAILKGKRKSKYLERGPCECCGDRPIAPGNRKLCTVCYKDNSEECASVGFMSSRKGHSL